MKSTEKGNEPATDFGCGLCDRKFKSEMALNSHSLFDHGLYRPVCSTDIASKQDYTAEEIKQNIRRAITRMNQRFKNHVAHPEKIYFHDFALIKFGLKWLKENNYPYKYNIRNKQLKKIIRVPLDETEESFATRYFGLQKRKNNVRNYIRFNIEKDFGFTKELLYMVKEIHGLDSDYIINDMNRTTIFKKIMVSMCDCREYYHCPICTLRFSAVN